MVVKVELVAALSPVAEVELTKLSELFVQRGSVSLMRLMYFWPSLPFSFTTTLWFSLASRHLALSTMGTR